MRVVWWLAAVALAACDGDPGGRPIDGSPDADAAPPDAGARCDACCGNGVVEGNEACDDGDVTDFDGCSHDCRFESALVLQAIHEQPGSVGCDLNGDGTIDNTFGAALNDAARGLLSNYVSSTLLRGCVVGELWVLIGDDRQMLAAPFDLTILTGLNLDGTGDSNFSGSAQFRILIDNLDNMGRPIIMLHGSAPGGMLSTDFGRVTPYLPYCQMPGQRVPIEFDHATLAGTLSTDANGPTALTVRLCGARSARSWYNVTNDTGLAGTTLLDLLVIGINFGGYRITSTQPDFDADGDQLEVFMDTDGDGTIDLCIDGNGTQITGTTCLEDPRIADGYTEALDLDMVRARMAGRKL